MNSKNEKNGRFLTGRVKGVKMVKKKEWYVSIQVVEDPSNYMEEDVYIRLQHDSDLFA